MILVDDYRRSQLVWKDEMQVELWSEYNADKFLDVFWQIWPQKQIRAQNRPLLVKTSQLDALAIFFHRQTIWKCQKFSFLVEKKLARREFEVKRPLMRFLLWF